MTNQWFGALHWEANPIFLFSGIIVVAMICAACRFYVCLNLAVLVTCTVICEGVHGVRRKPSWNATTMIHVILFRRFKFKNNHSFVVLCIFGFTGACIDRIASTVR